MNRVESSRVETLCRDHGGTILGYFSRRVDSSADAADLMSDAMLTAWRRRADIPSPPEDLLWLYGVARNLLLNHRRGGRRRTAATEALAFTLATTLHELPPPSAEILDVRAALESLGALDREIITLTAWEGLSSIEIAVVVGMPPSTVRSRLASARTQIRAVLALESTA